MENEMPVAANTNMNIDAGESVTIKRGKLSGQAGEVVSVGNGEAAVRLADGALTVQKISNLKLPEQPTIGLSDLAAVVQTWAGSGVDHGDVWNLVRELDAKLPGLAAKVTLPAASPQDEIQH